MVNAVVHERRGDSAQRWASIISGAAVICLVTWLTYETGNATARPPRLDADAAAAASAAAAQTQAAPPATATSVSGDAGIGPVEQLDASFFLPPLTLGDAGVLPSSAPRTVKIGVVLVSFQGAEGAPPNARSKRDAQAIAERLGQDARSDFHHAVTSGDTGSSDDIGRLPRGVLDPRTEVAVFALAPGEISDVLETPRGYWIVKRIE